jgi:hypothetical protein
VSNDNGAATLESPDIQSLILKPGPTPVDRGLLKLDLGCGQNKREGFIGVDKFAAEGVDVVHDLCSCSTDSFTGRKHANFPWPDNSVGEVHCSHFFEHIPALVRPLFMDELWRVMAHGAKALFITPFSRSYRATQDFTHEWPPITEQSYLYFNKSWREANKLTHGYYDMQCDFDWMYADAMRADWAGKHEQQRAFAREHYMNVVEDLHVTLIARKETK